MLERVINLFPAAMQPYIPGISNTKEGQYHV